MQAYYLVALWAVVAWFIFRRIESWITSRRHAREAERLGCKPPPSKRNRLPLGIDFVREALQSDRDKVFPDFMHTVYKRMGSTTFQHHIMGGTGFSTNDPKNIQALLATQFKDFGLGSRRQGMLAPLLGIGIFTADGRIWEHSRAMMRPQFNRDQVSDLEHQENHVQNLMRALVSDNSRWTSQVDLSTLFFRLTLDSACEFLFGESVDSQLAALPEFEGMESKIKDSSVDEKNFAAAFDRSQAWLARRARFMSKYWLSDSLAARRDCANTHKFVDYFVRRALAHQTKGEKDVEHGSSKPKYVFLEALAEQTRDPKELRDQLLNILLAGRDTTASLLGWTFWLLARHDDVFQKLRTAIIDSFGPYDPNDASRLTYVSLKNCQYLQHVLTEALRLYPVVPGNFREALKDTTLPRGGGPDGQSPIFIPKGSQIDYSVHVMHRLPQHWGPDAEEFKPERWLGRKPGWEYLPFNGGPRICLGRKFYFPLNSAAIFLLTDTDFLNLYRTIRPDRSLVRGNETAPALRFHPES